MEEALAFIRQYLIREHYAEMSRYTASSEEDFVMDCLELAQLCEGGTEPPIRAPPGTDWSGDQEHLANEYAERKLYMARRYTHPRHGELFAFHVSDNRERTRLSQCLYAANTGRGLKVIARYVMCDPCRGTGQRDGQPCEECHGGGWHHEAGQELSELGEPREAKLFGLPSDERDWPAWKSLVGMRT